MEKVEELEDILGVLTTGPEGFPPYILSSLFEPFQTQKLFSLLTENQKQHLY
jgi:C4-dicarboxylate-specific signal transduction histidine kinase